MIKAVKSDVPARRDDVLDIACWITALLKALQRAIAWSAKEDDDPRHTFSHFLDDVLSPRNITRFKSLPLHAIDIFFAQGTMP